MRISDWSSDVCSSDLCAPRLDDSDRMEGLAIAVPIAAMIIIGRAAITEKAEHCVVEGARTLLVADRQIDVVDEPAHGHANAPINAKMPAPLSAGQDRQSTRLNSSH